MNTQQNFFLDGRKQIKYYKTKSSLLEAEDLQAAGEQETADKVQGCKKHNTHNKTIMLKTVNS